MNSNANEKTMKLIAIQRRQMPKYQRYSTVDIPMKRSVNLVQCGHKHNKTSDNVKGKFSIKGI